MKVLTPRLVALGVSVTVLAAAPAALAAAGGFQLNVHGFYIIDFIVLVALLYYFAAKPARAFLVQRHEAVAKEMEEATRLKTEAQARFAKYDALLASLEGEIAQIRTDFRADGEREKERILAEAREQTEKMRRDAEKRLQQEAAQIRDDLEQEFAARALELAEHKVAQRMTPQVQRSLVKSYVQELERLEGLSAFSTSRQQVPPSIPT